MCSWLSDRPRNSLSPRNCCFEMSNEHTHAPIHSGGADTPPPMLKCPAHGNSRTRDNAPAMQGPNPLSQFFKRRTCVPFESSATVDALNPKPSASTVTNLADAHCCYKMRRRPLSHNAVGNLRLGGAMRRFAREIGIHAQPKEAERTRVLQHAGARRKQMVAC
jgi:hypothetical protein